MKKLFVMFIMLLIFSFVYAQEESASQEDNSQISKEEVEEVKEKAENAQKELTEETEPQKEEAEPEKEEEPQKEEESAKKEPERIYKSENKPVFLEEFKPVEKEKTKKWSFLPISIALGTTFQVGFTIAQFTHKNFEIRIGSMMLGPGFRFGSKVKDDDGFVPGLTFMGEVAFGKFFGNPLKESCFGLMIGVGSKIIFDIRNIEDDWEDGIYDSDPLYIDFLPLYLTYRWNKGERFYDLSLRIPLVWQNGSYVFTDETKLYNGLPDLTLNFSFVF